MTLYEVVLATVILLGSVAVLGQLIGMGSRAAVQAELRSRAALLCESKMAEVVSGIESLQSVSNVPFDAQHADWVWSLVVQPGPHADLLDVSVTVRHVGGNRQADVSQTLRRFIRDPQIFLDEEGEETVTFE
jgi:general secretion pathway protein I